LFPIKFFSLLSLPRRVRPKDLNILSSQQLFLMFSI